MKLDFLCTSLSLFVVVLFGGGGWKFWEITENAQRHRESQNVETEFNIMNQRRKKILSPSLTKNSKSVTRPPLSLI